MLLTLDNTVNFAWSAAIFFSGYIIATVFVLPFFSSKTKYLDSQVWVGLKKQWFSQLRAGLATISKTRDFVVEGYEQFSKTGKTWVMPQFLAEPIVMLPADKLHEVLALSDEQLDHHGPNSESTQPKYTAGTELVDGVHFDVVRRQLTRRLPLLTTDVHEELALGMEHEWSPKADEWTTVPAYESCMKIVSRAANRVFCGTVLCRNPEFLEYTRQFAIETFAVGFKLRIFPKWLHPIVGRIVNRPLHKALAICKAICLPVIEERMRNLAHPELAKGTETPNDALQWMLEDVATRAKVDPKELDMDLNVRRLMVLNMVAIHTTSIVTTNTILDMYSHPDAEMYVAGLREEVERVLKEYDGKWTKDAVNKLVRVDSVIRETMRVSTLADLGLKRKVSSPSGITLSDGTHIPQGVIVAFPQYSIHQDPSFYPSNPSSWDGFRFSAPREIERNSETKDDLAKKLTKEELSRVLEQKNKNLTATGTDFLSFGHGRHACPGRFFASQEMKLMLAHIVVNYDIRVKGGVRPKNVGIAGASVPSDEGRFDVKLRQK